MNNQARSHTTSFRRPPGVNFWTNPRRRYQLHGQTLLMGNICYSVAKSRRLVPAIDTRNTRTTNLTHLFAYHGSKSDALVRTWLPFNLYTSAAGVLARRLIRSCVDRPEVTFVSRLYRGTRRPRACGWEGTRPGIHYSRVAASKFLQQ